MDMSGDRLITAPRAVVWAALNDPAVLRACIPGCDSIEKLSDTEMTAIVNAKIGPIDARFNGAVTLADLDPPYSYTISGEGQGGVAGFAKGSAKIRLEEVEGGTTLHYAGNAQVGGKMAQLGARLIDSVAKSYAEIFFIKFSEQVAPAMVAPQPHEEDIMDDHAHTHPPAPKAHDAHAYDPSNPVFAGLPIGIWIPLIISVVVVAIVLAKFIG
ncbi:MAG: carbon monoxide dehydrogenase subunit G [Acidiphilium sp.]|nr:carbon monoxide dehydrogenase subunit G [Acidiphilium sp.]MDD4935291.1 carbon monoxide dehydrogenase subunit G [Acidiphilium sp.]